MARQRVDPEAAAWEVVLRSAGKSRSRIYFMQCGGPMGPVKIGRARDPEKRVQNVQVGNPQDVVLRAYMPGGPRTEKMLQERHAKRWLRGEWYHWCVEIEEDIQRAAAVGRSVPATLEPYAERRKSPTPPPQGRGGR